MALLALGALAACGGSDEDGGLAGTYGVTPGNNCVRRMVPRPGYADSPVECQMTLVISDETPEGARFALTQPNAALGGVGISCQGTATRTASGGFAVAAPVCELAYELRNCYPQATTAPFEFVRSSAVPDGLTTRIEVTLGAPRAQSCTENVENVTSVEFTPTFQPAAGGPPAAPTPSGSPIPQPE